MGSKLRPGTQRGQAGQRWPWGGLRGLCLEHYGQIPQQPLRGCLPYRLLPTLTDFFKSPFSCCISVPSPLRARSRNLLTPMAAPLVQEPCLESLLKHADSWALPQKIPDWDPGICIKRCPLVEHTVGSPLSTLETGSISLPNSLQPTLPHSLSRSPPCSPPWAIPSSYLLSPLPTSTQPSGHCSLLSLRDQWGPQSSLEVRGWGRHPGRQDLTP